MPKASSASLLFVTVPDRRTAKSIAAAVLAERLAACVQILPAIESHYRWKGRLETSRELLLLLKTTRRGVPALRRRILALHPYETPQCVSVRIETGNADYLRWISDSVPVPGRAGGASRSESGSLGGRGGV